MKAGDSNTAFFHRSTVVERARNLISEIKNNDGQIVKGREAISDVLLDYFKKRWMGVEERVWEGDLSCIDPGEGPECGALQA